jgi:AAA family ATP:ADP antiporter
LPRAEEKKRIGGSLWSGFDRVIHSPYLVAIGGQTVATTVTATFLYFQQARIVQAAALDPNTRTAMFATIDFWVNVAAGIVQLIGTGQLLRHLGLSVGLSVTPVINALGSAALAISPRLGVLIAVQAARRASHYAVERPSREVLFTVVAAEDKYKAKNFLDTLVYRFGDFAGSQLFAALGALGLAIRGTAVVAIPISMVWLGLVLFLARRANVTAHEEARIPPERGGDPAASA